MRLRNRNITLILSRYPFITSYPINKSINHLYFDNIRLASVD